MSIHSSLWLSQILKFDILKTLISIGKQKVEGQAFVDTESF